MASNRADSIRGDDRDDLASKVASATAAFFRCLGFDDGHALADDSECGFDVDGRIGRGALDKASLVIQ